MWYECGGWLVCPCRNVCNLRVAWWWICFWLLIHLTTALSCPPFLAFSFLVFILFTYISSSINSSSIRIYSFFICSVLFAWYDTIVLWKTNEANVWVEIWLGFIRIMVYMCINMSKTVRTQFDRLAIHFPAWNDCSFSIGVWTGTGTGFQCSRLITTFHFLNNFIFGYFYLKCHEK